MLSKCHTVCDCQLTFAAAITDGMLERDVEVMVSAVDGPLTVKGMELHGQPLRINSSLYGRNGF